MSPSDTAGGRTEQVDFYARLDAFDSFDDVADLSRFRPLPLDWAMVISDIRDSTPAIDGGRYKDVNMVGASTIVAAINALPDVELPFVFGGDGATLAIPESMLAPVQRALLQTRALAARHLGLELRVGVVPARVIRDYGHEVLVGKLRVSPGNHLALFAGGGVELADRLIKDDEDGSAGFRIATETEDAEPDLSGLSCRWEPLHSARGRILTLLVRARSGDLETDAATYREILEDLGRILSADPLGGRPARPENLRFRWPPRALHLEAVLTRGGRSRIRRLIQVGIQSLGQFFCELFKLKIGGYDGRTYTEELQRNTDHRRFDGTLCIVADCTQDELERLDRLLERMHAEGRVFYGTHVTQSALMTCLVFDWDEKRHLHFIDGDDGGFTVASKQLKAQIAEAREAGNTADAGRGSDAEGDSE